MSRIRRCIVGIWGIFLVCISCLTGFGAAISNRIAAPLMVPRAPVAMPANPQLSLDSYLVWDSPLKQMTVTNGTPTAEFIFYLTNISAGPVVVSNVQTSCGCTVARVPKLPWVIAPGDKGQVEVAVDLAYKIGTLIKAITFSTDKGAKILYVRPTILPPPPGAMNPAERASNLRLATADRQSVFQSDCARCHVEPAKGKAGRELYAAACGICHESEHRATMVPNLHAIPEETNVKFWKNWISHGKPGTLMPAFAESDGGILTEAQIDSLVSYLTATIPSKQAVPEARTDSMAR